MQPARHNTGERGMSMATDDFKEGIGSKFSSKVTRRDFIKYTAGTAAFISWARLPMDAAAVAARP
jgi:hypothetical protein